MVERGRSLMWAEAALKASTDGGPLSQLPTGTVTFLLSDIEGSTRLWSEHPGVMPKAVSEVYAIFDEAVARHEGVRPVEQGEGDSVVAAFSRASDSLAAAFEGQRALHTKSWADGMELRVRISLHTAEAQVRAAGNYFGMGLSRRRRSRATLTPISGSRPRGARGCARSLPGATHSYRTRPTTSWPIACPMA